MKVCINNDNKKINNEKKNKIPKKMIIITKILTCFLTFSIIIFYLYLRITKKIYIIKNFIYELSKWTLKDEQFCRFLIIPDLFKCYIYKVLMTIIKYYYIIYNFK